MIIINNHEFEISDKIFPSSMVVCLLKKKLVFRGTKIGIHIKHCTRMKTNNNCHISVPFE